MIVITIARKPLEGSVASNTLKHGTGGLNIDRSRIGTEESLDGGAYAKNPTPRAGKDLWTQDRKGDTNCMRRGDYEQPAGRFPANLILAHLPECRCVGSKKIKGGNDPRGSDGKRHGGDGLFVEGGGHGTHVSSHDGYSDSEGKETVEAWVCAPGCPVADLNAQSGGVGGGGSGSTTGALGQNSGWNQHANRPQNHPGFKDKGGASRFFKQVGGQR